jgi:lipopolysaccharide/colanic/teichoic acid biosynthesis glycosyltransferase
VGPLERSSTGAIEELIVRSGDRAFAKRAVDMTISALLLLLFLPITVFIALLVALESPGPPFYSADRVGRGGRRFGMLKFRKMPRDAAGAPLTIRDDGRFTRVGRVLAVTKLDELPQLWNVLIGDMSLVGPRPEDPGFVAMHASDFEPILRVRPGITGLSQLAYAREGEILDASDPIADYVHRILPQKLRLDRLYASGLSRSGDRSILWWTAIAVVFRRSVAVHRETGALTFRRPRTPSQSVPGRAS